MQQQFVMRALLAIAAFALAAPAAAQDTQEIGEWSIVKTAIRCTVATNSADTLIAFSFDKTGGAGALRVINPAWTLDPARHYAATVSFSETLAQNKVDLRVAQSADGKRLLSGPLAESVASAFKASDMLSMQIDGIDDFISVNITDGPKIWAAVEACIAGLSG